MKEISEIIVIFDESGTTPLNSISEKTFHSFQILSDNIIEITEQSGIKTECKINPHNKHVLQAIKRWQA